MKKKILSVLLCMVFLCTLSLPVYADSDSSSSDGYSVIISDIPKNCPTCGSALHASWASTSGAEVEVEISDAGKIKIPAGAGAFAHITLKCDSCGYEKTETRLLGLDFGHENPGKLQVVKAPSGIGRKDLPGYCDTDDSKPSINSNGYIGIVMEPYCYVHTDGSGKTFTTSIYTPSSSTIVEHDSVGSGIRIGSSGYRFYWKATAPVDGIYFLGSLMNGEKYLTYSYFSSNIWKTYQSNPFNFGSTVISTSATYRKDNVFYLCIGSYIASNVSSYPYKYEMYPFVLYCEPLGSTNVTNYNNITINNNTWSGNIYVDNSTNLTYIYPEYTTINDSGDTVTNISNNPIIYNSETNQYYTYDSTTNNYYYITYGDTPATPTPSPSPDPDNPGTDPTPTPTPGGGSSGGSGSSSNISGGDDEGLFSWLWDLLKDLVKAILKAIFKVLSGILGFLIWLVERVGLLFPFLPAPAVAALGAGVVLVFVIKIIRFIRG